MYRNLYDGNCNSKSTQWVAKCGRWKGRWNMVQRKSAEQSSSSKMDTTMLLPQRAFWSLQQFASTVIRMFHQSFFLDWQLYPFVHCEDPECERSPPPCSPAWHSILSTNCIQSASGESMSPFDHANARANANYHLDAARCVFPFRLCAIRSLSNHGSRICRDCAARLRYIHTWMDTSFIQAHWIFQRVSLERMAGHSTSHSSGNNMLPPKVPIWSYIYPTYPYDPYDPFGILRSSIFSPAFHSFQWLHCRTWRPML